MPPIDFLTDEELAEIEAYDQVLLMDPTRVPLSRATAELRVLRTRDTTDHGAANVAA